MKANVPEKLYCCDKGNGNIFVDYRPFPNDDNVEYTRADAFIEKAAGWLKENIYKRVYKQGDCLGFPTAEFLEEFKKAMKL